MSSICTASGRRFWPMGPNPDDIVIEDVAHALGNMCRYTGHVSTFWSVAAHSIEVSHRVEKEVRSKYDDDRVIAKFAMTGLLHDAGETYLVDVPRPIKPLFLNYKQWSDELDEAIAERFGTFFPHPDVVKAHDAMILLDEIRQFFSPTSYAWKKYGVSRIVPVSELSPLAPSGFNEILTPDGAGVFLARHHELEGRMR